MTFGQRLKELRKARGMTQTELAQKTGISFTYVSKLETGAMSPPRQNAILALAQALEINEADTDKLFGLAGKIPPELLAHIDIQIIDVLRSLKDGEQQGGCPDGGANENPVYEAAATGPLPVQQAGDSRQELCDRCERDEAEPCQSLMALQYQVENVSCPDDQQDDNPPAP